MTLTKTKYIQKSIKIGAQLGKRVVNSNIEAHHMGVRNNIAVLNIEATLLSFYRALYVIKKVIEAKGHILILNTNPELSPLVKKVSNKIQSNFSIRVVRPVRNTHLGKQTATLRGSSGNPKSPAMLQSLQCSSALCSANGGAASAPSVNKTKAVPLRSVNVSEMSLRKCMQSSGPHSIGVAPGYVEQPPQRMVRGYVATGHNHTIGTTRPRVSDHLILLCNDGAHRDFSEHIRDNEKMYFSDVSEWTSKIHISYCNDKWIGGTFTNWKQIAQSVAIFAKFYKYQFNSISQQANYRYVVPIFFFSRSAARSLRFHKVKPTKHITGGSGGSGQATIITQSRLVKFPEHKCPEGAAWVRGAHKSASSLGVEKCSDSDNQSANLVAHMPYEDEHHSTLDDVITFGGPMIPKGVQLYSTQKGSMEHSGELANPNKKIQTTDKRSDQYSTQRCTGRLLKHKGASINQNSRYLKIQKSFRGLIILNKIIKNTQVYRIQAILDNYPCVSNAYKYGSHPLTKIYGSVRPITINRGSRSTDFVFRRVLPIVFLVRQNSALSCGISPFKRNPKGCLQTRRGKCSVYCSFVRLAQPIEGPACPKCPSSDVYKAAPGQCSKTKVDYVICVCTFYSNVCTFRCYSVLDRNQNLYSIGTPSETRLLVYNSLTFLFYHLFTRGPEKLRIHQLFRERRQTHLCPMLCESQQHCYSGSVLKYDATKLHALSCCDQQSDKRCVCVHHSHYQLRVLRHCEARDNNVQQQWFNLYNERSPEGAMSNTLCAILTCEYTTLSCKWSHNNTLGVGTLRFDLASKVEFYGPIQRWRCFPMPNLFYRNFASTKRMSWSVSNQGLAVQTPNFIRQIHTRNCDFDTSNLRFKSTWRLRAGAQAPGPIFCPAVHKSTTHLLILYRIALSHLRFVSSNMGVSSFRFGAMKLRLAATNRNLLRNVRVIRTQFRVGRDSTAAPLCQLAQRLRRERSYSSWPAPWRLRAAASAGSGTFSASSLLYHLSRQRQLCTKVDEPPEGGRRRSGPAAYSTNNQTTKHVSRKAPFIVYKHQIIKDRLRERDLRLGDRPRLCPYHVLIIKWRLVGRRPNEILRNQHLPSIGIAPRQSSLRIALLDKRFDAPMRLSRKCGRVPLESNLCRRSSNPMNYDVKLCFNSIGDLIRSDSSEILGPSYVMHIKAAHRHGPLPLALARQRASALFESASSSALNVHRLPFGNPCNLLIVLNPNENKVAIREARQLGLPILSFVDSNTKFMGITYPIIGNSRSVRLIHLFMSWILKLNQIRTRHLNQHHPTPRLL